MNKKQIQTIRNNKIEIKKNFYVNKKPSQFLKNNFDIQHYHEFNALILLTLETPNELCRFLQTPFDELQEEINQPKYKSYSIEKKRGGKREIFAPSSQLRRIQRRLNYFLQGYYLSIKPKEVTGFVIQPSYLESDCNIVENAKPHIGKKQVLNIDLKDFFPTISAREVKALFSSPLFEFNEQIANALTLLTTYKGKLPTGAPTSPVISNFLCFHLDKELVDFCQKKDFNYSRYADDLTFSSDYKMEDNDMLDLINIITKNGFIVNYEKLRLKSAGRKQTVTGIIVNEKINVDRKLLKKVRAMLHDLALNGILIATQNHFQITDFPTLNQLQQFQSRLEGYINFIGQVRGKTDEMYLRFRNQLKEIQTKNVYH